MNSQLESSIDWIQNFHRLGEPVEDLEWPASLPIPSGSEVKEAECALGVRLPPSFIDFLRRTAECRLPEFFVAWIAVAEFEEALGCSDIVKLAKELWSDPRLVPSYALPFFADGCGNYACFDLREASGELPVLLWDIERHITEPGMVLELDHAAPDFSAWLEEALRDWRRAWLVSGFPRRN